VLPFTLDGRAQVGLKPQFLARPSMRSRVSGRTVSLLEKVRDTVAVETFAIFANCRNVNMGETPM